jgi:hypothetical protein
MSSVLVSGITDVFRSQVAGPFASNTGESESSVVRGFETGLGAMVQSLAAKLTAHRTILGYWRIREASWDLLQAMASRRNSRRCYSVAHFQR